MFLKLLQQMVPGQLQDGRHVLGLFGDKGDDCAVGVRYGVLKV